MGNIETTEEWSPCLPSNGDEEVACKICPLNDKCPYPSLYSCPTINDILTLRAKRVNKIRKLNLSKGKAYSALGKPLVGLNYVIISRRKKASCRIERACCNTDTGMVSLFICIDIRSKKENTWSTSENLEIKDACNSLGIVDMRAVRAAIVQRIESKL